MDNLSPGIHKLIHHIDHLHNMKQGKPVAPIHISVWPTRRCNFSCSYCCCKNTSSDKTPDLDLSTFLDAVDVCARYGTKAIEFSGGGEPLLWAHFSEAVDAIVRKGIKISLITNGTYLHTIPVATLNKLAWLRISYQSTSHAQSIDYSRLSGVRHSGSYIITPKSHTVELDNLYDFANSNDIVIRFAVQRPCTDKFANIAHSIIKDYGYPFFFSDKPSGQASGCYMAWIRAAIDWNGNLLPCPAIQLNSEYQGLIPDDFILCNIANIETWINENPAHDLGHTCSYCNCGKDHNDFFYNFIQPCLDTEFV
jgi:organic radical activating enzyme